MSRRDLVKDAILNCLAARKWNVLARRRSLKRLYFQLRADGMGGHAARGVCKRAKRALPALREEPKGLNVALDLIVG
jgi:hypothetical protein